ncbi:unnamed protein product [Calypogeia fissa]
MAHPDSTEWLDAKRSRLMYKETHSATHYFRNAMLKWKAWKTQHKKDSIVGFKERILHVLMTEDCLPEDKARAMGRIDEPIIDTSDDDCPQSESDWVDEEHAVCEAYEPQNSNSVQPDDKQPSQLKEVAPVTCTGDTTLPHVCGKDDISDQGRQPPKTQSTAGNTALVCNLPLHPLVFGLAKAGGFEIKSVCEGGIDHGEDERLENSLIHVPLDPVVEDFYREYARRVDPDLDLGTVLPAACHVEAQQTGKSALDLLIGTYGSEDEYDDKIYPIRTKFAEDNIRKTARCTVGAPQLGRGSGLKHAPDPVPVPVECFMHMGLPTTSQAILSALPDMSVQPRKLFPSAAALLGCHTCGHRQRQ